MVAPDASRVIYPDAAIRRLQRCAIRGNLRPMKILLAEDDNDMRRFLVKALQNAGFDVASFDNGLSAYNRLREEPFELLLTDIVMPEMDGIELARRATELDPDRSEEHTSELQSRQYLVCRL